MESSAKGLCRGDPQMRTSLMPSHKGARPCVSQPDDDSNRILPLRREPSMCNALYGLVPYEK